MARIIGSRNGQFSIIAAILLVLILVSAIVITYSIINFSLPKEQTNVLSSIYEMNNSLKQMLEFAVGYYCSVLRVTGNSTFAHELALNYLNSGFEFIAESHPELNPIIHVSNINFSTRWYEISSYSAGFLSANYSLLSKGLNNIGFDANCSLSVNIVEVTDSSLSVNVTRDGGLPYFELEASNFMFYYYDNESSSWMQTPPSSFSSQNNLYILGFPAQVDETCFLLQVTDNRGISTINFYTSNKRPQYTYVFDWNYTGMGDIYSQLSHDKIVVEVLQNGTLRWLGQKLLDGKPIPPIPVKSLRVSANSDSFHLQENQIAFQVEDWASNYKVPLGRSNNETIFSSRNMIVFLIDHTIKNVTIWWDGRDTAKQTPYASKRNFNDKILEISGVKKAVLFNNVIQMNITYGNGNFYIETSTSRADFMRINGHNAKFGASPSFPVINGTVRDIIQQEAEWADYKDEGFPNTYAQIVLTLPANTTYYTYSLRLILVNASTCPENRTIDDLTPIIVSSYWKMNMQILTENGTINGIPVAAETSIGTYMFYNFSDGKWEHHWSQFNSSDGGAGIIFRDLSNLNLYAFDALAGQSSGALTITTKQTAWITPISVYDKCGESAPYVATNAIDGDTGTFWRHYSTCYHWIILDLGERKNVSRVRIYQRNYDWGGSAGIKVYVTDDPQNWGLPVWTGVISGYGWEYSGQFQAQGRYIILESQSDSWSQRLYEVQVKVSQVNTTIEFSPIKLKSVSFQQPLDITWFGAVVTIKNTEMIYDPSSNVGLWVIVEHPPKVEIIV